MKYQHLPCFCPSMVARSPNKGFDSFSVFIVSFQLKNHNCQYRNWVDCRCRDTEMILYSINTAGYN